MMFKAFLVIASVSLLGLLCFEFRDDLKSNRSVIVYQSNGDIKP